jgi:hypothetical protein
MTEEVSRGGAVARRTQRNKKEKREKGKRGIAEKDTVR